LRIRFSVLHFFPGFQFITIFILNISHLANSTVCLSAWITNLSNVFYQQARSSPRKSEGDNPFPDLVNVRVISIFYSLSKIIWTVPHNWSGWTSLSGIANFYFLLSLLITTHTTPFNQTSRTHFHGKALYIWTTWYIVVPRTYMTHRCT